MRHILALVLATLLAACGGGGGGSGPYIPPVPQVTEYVLTGTHNGQPVKVSANSRFGAAIYSVTLGGFQFIDSSDHGREVQTAWQLDGQGEGQNPTEAGSAADGNGYTSSTRIIGAAVVNNAIVTAVNPAYWLLYGGQKTSPHVIEKTVTLGYSGRTNVIRHQIKMTLNEPHASMAVEGLTAYLNPVMTRFFTFDPVSKTKTEIFPDGTNLIQSNTPVMVANADLSKAYALLHKNPAHVYWIGKYGTWPKIDASWFAVSNPSGSYSWETFSIFGTVDEVMQSASLL